MALNALELPELDVGDVREKDVFRLARVGGPIGLAIGRDVAIDEVLFRDGRAHGRGVTAGALIERGDAREGSVVAKRVAIVAFEPRLVGVDLVAEIDRLRPALVDGAGEADPARAQGGQRARQKQYVSANPHGLSLLTRIDRKSTRLNSSHLGISYAVFCLKKKTK